MRRLPVNKVALSVQPMRAALISINGARLPSYHSALSLKNTDKDQGMAEWQASFERAGGCPASHPFRGQPRLNRLGARVTPRHRPGAPASR